ncbi:hypothetical protein OH77DRAFT_1432248 [Trametes cingulata]|nr:hypothetical protein OH77DRAFT_1432248 [Trametes cingulata]
MGSSPTSSPVSSSGHLAEDESSQSGREATQTLQRTHPGDVIGHALACPNYAPLPALLVAYAKATGNRLPMEDFYDCECQVDGRICKDNEDDKPRSPAGSSQSKVSSDNVNKHGMDECDTEREPAHVIEPLVNERIHDKFKQLTKISARSTQSLADGVASLENIKGAYLAFLEELGGLEKELCMLPFDDMTWLSQSSSLGPEQPLSQLAIGMAIHHEDANVPSMGLPAKEMHQQHWNPDKDPHIDALTRRTQSSQSESSLQDDSHDDVETAVLASCRPLDIRVSASGGSHPRPSPCTTRDSSFFPPRVIHLPEDTEELVIPTSDPYEIEYPYMFIPSLESTLAQSHKR